MGRGEWAGYTWTKAHKAGLTAAALSAIVLAGAIVGLLGAFIDDDELVNGGWGTAFGVGMAGGLIAFGFHLGRTSRDQIDEQLVDLRGGVDELIGDVHEVKQLVTGEQRGAVRALRRPGNDR